MWLLTTSAQKARGTLVAVLATAFALGGASQAAAALACGGGFTHEHSNLPFDGASVTVVTFRGQGIAMLTDNLGRWFLPKEASTGALKLTHRVAPDVRFTLCTLARTDAPVSKTSWNNYVRSLEESSGGMAKVLESLDSDTDQQSMRILGITTRSVVIRRVNPDGTGITIEHEIVAFDEKIAVIARMSAPEEIADAVARDLVFFFARLEKL